MEIYYRVQPAGKDIPPDWKSVDWSGEKELEGLCVHEMWWQVLQQEYAQQQQLDGPLEVIELKAPYDWDLNEEGLRVDPAKVEILRRWSWDGFLRLFGDYDDPDTLLDDLCEWAGDECLEDLSLDEALALFPSLPFDRSLIPLSRSEVEKVGVIFRIEGCRGLPGPYLWGLAVDNPIPGYYTLSSDIDSALEKANRLFPNGYFEYEYPCH